MGRGATTDLETFQAAAVPREAALVKRWSRKIEPTYGFVLYGILNLFPSSAGMMAGAFAAIGICDVLGLSPGVELVLASVLSIAGVVAAWVVFVRWVRRKRGRAVVLVRDGELIAATVGTRGTDRAVQLAAKVAIRAVGTSAGGLRWERTEFEHAGARYYTMSPFLEHPAAGTPAHVLFHPQSKYALTFAPNGVAYVSGVHHG